MKLLLSLMFISSFAFAQYVAQQYQSTSTTEVRVAVTETTALAEPELSAASVDMSFTAETLDAPLVIMQEVSIVDEADDSVTDVSTWKGKTQAEKLASLKAHLSSKSSVSESEITYKNYCSGGAIAVNSEMCGDR
jgi:Tfp pilus assembly protein PilV